LNNMSFKKMKKIGFFVLFLCFAWCKTMAQVNYLKESNEDFKKRMQWFADAKFGMFIHFGLYSQLGGIYNGKTVGEYAEWIQANADISREDYAKLINTWNPKNFDADKVVKLAKEAGMKYLVITTRHHEGFCLWDSEYTDFDIANSQMKERDLIKELSVACKKQGIVFGTYYSIIDRHHSSQYRNEEGNDNNARWFHVKMIPEKKEEYITYMKNQIRELIEKYDTEILWFDGDWADWWDMKNGEDLYNVGPTAAGIIPVYEQYPLLKLDEWLKINGEAIFGTRPWKVQVEADARFTSKGNFVYAAFLKWAGDEFKLKAVKPVEGSKITMLGVPGNLDWTWDEANGLTIKYPKQKARPTSCSYACALKFRLNRYKIRC